jgi:hypothetical protein
VTWPRIVDSGDTVVIASSTASRILRKVPIRVTSGSAPTDQVGGAVSKTPDELECHFPAAICRQPDMGIAGSAGGVRIRRLRR